MEKTYLCIDLKSFYASVECRERNLDPMNTNLVVADESRTEKTVCLAISPTMKQYGLGGRARLYEVLQKVKEVNYQRKKNNNYKKFNSKSYIDSELKNNKELELDFIIAPPQMKKYMNYSTKIYNVYLKYIAPEDIYVYSIDEVFCDLTNYLKHYNMSAKELVIKMIHDVYKTTGITATAGIGTNMYLAKVAMDIVAKHAEADEYGVRLAEIDEIGYRKLLWNHRPLTSFWRVGAGYAKKLEAKGLYTMGDIARCSINNEDLLYKMFGVNAELLIDHAWGWEPCTIADVKAYKPESNSIGSGQVLHCPYTYEQGRLIIREMTDLLVLDLVEKGLRTDQIVLTIGYDIENLQDPERSRSYHGPIKTDHYGRKVPQHAHGTINLEKHTSSTKLLINAAMELFERITDPNLLIRRVTITANHVTDEIAVLEENEYFEQLDLFTDYSAKEKAQKDENQLLEREKKMQLAVLDIKKKYGKNAILKGMNLLEGATTIDRNNQIGGHKA